jgi:hypothetical protein
VAVVFLNVFFSQALETESTLVLDGVDPVCVTLLHQHNGGSFLASAASPAGSVNVGLDVLGRLDLDDKGDVRKVKASGSHIGGDDLGDASTLEISVDAFPVALPHIAVQHLASISSHLVVKLSDLTFRLTENDASSLIFGHGLADPSDEFRDLTRTTNRIFEVFDGLGNSHLGIADQVNFLAFWVLVFFGNAAHPVRHGGREQQGLRFLAGFFHHCPENFFNVFLESLLQHLIGLVQNEALEAVELDGSSVDEVQQSARSGDDDIRASLDVAELVPHAVAAIDSMHSQSPVPNHDLVEEVLHLNGQFAGWNHHQNLGVIAAERIGFAEALKSGKGVGQRLAGPGPVLGSEVVSLDNGVERGLLDGEEADDAGLPKLFDHLGIGQVVLEVPVVSVLVRS